MCLSLYSLYNIQLIYDIETDKPLKDQSIHLTIHLETFFPTLNRQTQHIPKPSVKEIPPDIITPLVLVIGKRAGLVAERVTSVSGSGLKSCQSPMDLIWVMLS